MNCPACQHQNDLGTKFCEECGNKLARVCSVCGVDLKPASKFCPECGASSVVVAAATTSPVRNMADYTPKHLVEKILHSKSALEGERKQVTILFADVKGSMELAEQLDPEQWHQILDSFFQILSDGVHRFEGTINQYTGDGIMALFGAPIAHEDHAQRACYAALYLRAEIARYATEVKRQYGLGFSTRMGINSGEVVVGSIGDDLRMDYTAQGHTVGLAQRMESLAEPNTCFLSAATAGLVSGYFAMDDLGQFRVKGTSAPLHVYRLAGIGDSRNRFDISRSHGLSRFVGRASDLRTLEDALAQTLLGHGQVVGVVAEAGTGKSRLRFEFLEECRARGLQVYEGRAVAHGRNISLLPILEVLRAYFGITVQDNPRGAREKIAGRLVVLDQRYADALPLLFDFLGVPDVEHPAPPLDPEVRQRQLIDLMREVTQRSATSQPMVTMIEDLHWLDDSSAEFLEHMVDVCASTRCLLLLNFRPEYRADWMQKSWYRQIPLTPLGRESVTELLADLLGNDPSLDALVNPILARTGGNPFFIEEIAQSLIEAGQVIGAPGAYRLVTSVEHLTVPATVQAVLAARIDRLTEHEKRVLQVAAVIGRNFSEPLLAEMVELSTQELKTALTALRRAEFIHEQAVYPDAEYIFRHPLTQEVALGSQLKERRRQRHSQVAKAIEQRNLDSLDESAALLAHHWQEAGEALNAARWHRRAAEWMSRTDYAGARLHWDQVRVSLRDLPAAHEALALGHAACTHLLSTAFRVDTSLVEVRTLLEEGQRYATALGEQRAYFRLTQAYGFALYGTGDVAGFFDIAVQNHRVAAETTDVSVQLQAAASMVFAYFLTSCFAEAIRLAEDAFTRFSRHVLPEDWLIGMNPYALLKFWYGLCQTSTGRLAAGLESLIQARRIAEEDDTPDLICATLAFAAETHYRAGNAEHALSSAYQVEEVCQRLGAPPTRVALIKVAFGYAYLANGNAKDAIAAARVALENHERVEKTGAAWDMTLLTAALLDLGDLTGAESTATEAIAVSRRLRNVYFEAEGHGLMARILIRRYGLAGQASAEASLATAEELVRRIGAHTLGPVLCEWRAELAAVGGDDETHQRLLARAEQGYLEIGATGHALRLVAQREACLK